ncbi:MAG: DUF2220 family protein [Clostridia bacterium]|nr:DUF2220 family protein [Clostridia bacterium]
MSWTTPKDVKNQVQKLWDRGVILAAMAGGEQVFPLRLVLKGPTSKELSERFSEVREWIALLSGAERYYRLVWRQVNHRVLGENRVPAEIWIDHVKDALAFINQQNSAEKFSLILEQTLQEQPVLVPWLIKRPLRALELASVWPKLLDIVGWIRRHPRPAIYLRQIDLPGVHTKLVEEYRGVLAELFDLVLPSEQIDLSVSGIHGFCRRFGFLEKPIRVRFRLLDSSIRLLPFQADQDITVTEMAFAKLDLPVSKVFITENEINFLAFPNVSDAILIFGSGYGFDHLEAAEWLKKKAIYYWGDIDTHGFAILNQLRSVLPQTVSFLMDRHTLMAHQTLWGTEDRPETGNLMGLNHDEAKLYDQLRWNQLGERIRLEQERIGYDYLLAALSCL